MVDDSVGPSLRRMGSFLALLPAATRTKTRHTAHNEVEVLFVETVRYALNDCVEHHEYTSVLQRSSSDG